jgi:manganese transport protein
MGESATGDMLVFSQVLLSMQLGFAIVPLLVYVSDKKRMGDFAIGRWAKLGGWLSAAIIVTLNINLVVQQVTGWLESAGDARWAVQFLVIPALLVIGGLLVYIVVKPLLAKPSTAKRAQVPHGVFAGIAADEKPEYRNIAVCLDFSEADPKTLQHALHLGGKQAHYLLIHAVETAGAWVMGSDIADAETQEDVRILEQYVNTLRDLGYTCEARIGYGRAAKAIPEVLASNPADLLVMGAHGHRTIKDLIFGTTIGAVRHAVQVPVLIVR